MKDAIVANECVDAFVELAADDDAAEIAPRVVDVKMDDVVEGLLVVAELEEGSTCQIEKMNLGYLQFFFF